MSGLLLRLAGWTYQKTLIFSLILGGFYYMTLFDDGAVLDAQIQQIQAEIQKEEAKQAEAERALKEVEKVRAAVGTLSDQFKTVSQQLPSEVQMADVIRAVDAVSRSTGVSVKSKEPKPSTQKDVIEEIPLQVTLEGTFSEITSFLFYISSLERIMKIRSFSIRGPADISRSSVLGESARIIFEGNVISFRFIAGKGEVKK